MLKILTLPLFVLLSLIVKGQCTATNNLTTLYAENNGQDGIMFDIVALNDVVISCFDMNWDPGTFDFEVYYKTGTAQGFEANAGAWTLIGNGAGVVSAGNGNATNVPLNIGVGICSGNRASFYITNTGVGHADANYTNGTAIGNVFVADANIQILEMYGKAYPFGASYSPRVFNGTVFYNAGNCIVLPVELLDFQTTAVNDRSVSLTWQTASEKDNDYFEIHRSTDMENWEFVAEVDGAGNNTGLLDYSTEDYAPHSGVSYYRLTQFDFNGESSSGGVKSVVINQESDGGLSLFPNPTLGKLKIVGSEDELENVQLLNSLGQPIEMTVLADGSNNVTIDLSNLASGVYFLQSGERTYKVIRE